MRSPTDGSHRDVSSSHFFPPGLECASSHPSLLPDTHKFRFAKFIVVTGGTRSGKSRFAVDLASRFSGQVVYLATCDPSTDPEMRQRIARHRRGRPAHWRTLEHPADPARAITRLPATTGGLIIDCLTIYVSGLLVRGRSEPHITQQVRRLCAAIRRAPFPVILVTNEVGLGIVPDYLLGRRFRDLAGLANQIAAASADHVVLMVAGIPLWITGGDLPVTAGSFASVPSHNGSRRSRRARQNNTRRSRSRFEVQGSRR